MLPACLAAEDEEMTIESRKDENEETRWSGSYLFRAQNIWEKVHVVLKKFRKNFSLWRETYFHKTIANKNVNLNKSVGVIYHTVEVILN